MIGPPCRGKKVDLSTTYIFPVGVARGDSYLGQQEPRALERGGD